MVAIVVVLVFHQIVGHTPVLVAQASVVVVAVAAVVVEGILRIPRNSVDLPSLVDRKPLQIRLVEQMHWDPSFPFRQTSFLGSLETAPSWLASLAAFPSSSIVNLRFERIDTDITLAGLNSFRRFVCLEQYAVHVNSSKP